MRQTEEKQPQNRNYGKSNKRQRHSTSIDEDDDDGSTETEEEEEEQEVFAVDDDNNDSNEDDGGDRDNKREEDEREFEQMLQVYKDTIAVKKAIKKVPKLQAWIDQQRKEYNAFKDRSAPTTMTVDRLARMTMAKFPFQPRQTLSWDVRANQWREYYQEHGHDPPKKSKILGKWMYNQRAKYEERQAGKKNNLTDEQIQKLTEWGFKWEFRYKLPTNKAPAKSWDERLQDLVEFKRIHGHTSPPEHLPGLGGWVKTQKTEYHRSLRGLSSGLTKERLAKLNEIGFDFAYKRAVNFDNKRK